MDTPKSKYLAKDRETLFSGLLWKREPELLKEIGLDLTQE